MLDFSFGYHFVENEVSLMLNAIPSACSSEWAKSNDASIAYYTHCITQSVHVNL